MKIITILILCLTALLSFAYSTILNKAEGDAFIYDYSGLCADIEILNCKLLIIPPATKVIIDFPFEGVGSSISASMPCFSDFKYILIDKNSDRYTIGINSEFTNTGCSTNTYITNAYQKYYFLLFSNVEDANAYFNIHILNNTPSNQLGYLRWVTELTHHVTNDNTLDIQVSENSHLTSFGTQIIESLIFVSIQNPFCTTQFKLCSAQIIDTIIIQADLKPKPKRVIHDF